MNKVSEERIKLRVEYSRETDLIFSDNIPAYADWLEKKLALSQHDVSVCACGSKEYYTEQYKDVVKYYCKSCHERISRH